MPAKGEGEMTEEKDKPAAGEKKKASTVPASSEKKPETTSKSSPESTPAVQETSFSELEAATAKDGGQRNLDFLMDIPLEVSVELGRSKMLMADLLRLGQGSVVGLDKTAGEPVDILVNKKLMARGEVVVVNDKFGIRLTDIISPAERVKQLG
jgi:flagellar motor switch protein FliN/FliY